MTEKQKIESYFINLDLTFEEVTDNTWLIYDHEKGLDQVLIVAAPPVVIIRVKIMEIKEEMSIDFYKELLKLNSADLVHGAYALDGSEVVLLDTHEFATMDIEELQASLDAISLALTQHIPVLSKYVER